MSWNVLPIPGDITFIDYEMSEFRDETSDIGAMFNNREMLELIGKEMAKNPWWGAFVCETVLVSSVPADILVCKLQG